MNKNIAIDGPAGAGKSTIAKLVAKKLGSIYVDTGAMYRAIGLYMTENSVDKSDIEAVKNALGKISLDIRYEDGVQQIILNGENVSGKIRTPEIGSAASAFAVIPEVRSGLTDLQRELAKRSAVVMDGRDIGTVVLPDASVKIFLTASVEVRADRRYKELAKKGEEVNIKEIEADIRRRDEQDMTRKTAPLKQADDAVLLDSSSLSIDEVADRIIEIAKEKVPTLREVKAF